MRNAFSLQHISKQSFNQRTNKADIESLKRILYCKHIHPSNNQQIGTAFKIYQDNQHNANIINLLLKICLNTKHPEKAIIIWNDIHKHHSHAQLRHISYPLLIKCYLHIDNKACDIVHHCIEILEYLKLIDYKASQRDARDYSINVAQLISKYHTIDHIKHIHRLINDDDIYIQTALINAYASVGCIDDAINVFDSTHDTHKDSVLIGAMMTALIHHNKHQNALDIYNEYNALHNDVIHMLAIKACTETNDLRQGADIHSNLKTIYDITLKDSLIEMWGRFGDIQSALNVFENGAKDVISVNSMMTSSEYPMDDHDNVTLDDVYSCIKVLKKIKRFPHILSTPLFNPIHHHLRQAVDISNASSSQLLHSLKLTKKQRRQSLKTDDHKLKMSSGIRIARQHRADESEQLRQYLETQIHTTAPAIQTGMIDSDGDMEMDPPPTTSDDNHVAVLSIDNTSEHKDNPEFIEVHGQILTTCTASELFGDNNNNTNEQKLNFNCKCYVCKTVYRTQHFFYDAMCRDCGDYNFYQRFDCHSCKDKVAIVTGGRIKIGYEIVLKLLRAQCSVIVTTRFPRYAAIKYAKEKDFEAFKDRLSIFGLDFCRLQSVDKFIKYVMKQHKHIDFLINNAASTVRRTQEFYKEILKTEKKALPPNVAKQLVIEYEHFTEAHEVSQPLALDMDHKRCIEHNGQSEEENIMKKVLGDIGNYDEHAQPIDLRHNNSWTAMIGSIHPVEAMEVIMVNQFVPFLLINQLIPLLANGKESANRSYVMNVSAMEGRFHFLKQGTHPHTNMAKAALNMLTRTSAAKLAQQHNIFMVSVDTGWVTDELPLKRRIKSGVYERKQRDMLDADAQNDKNNFIFHPPLDEVDGAARVLHPIWNGLRGKPYVGVFLKDYRRIDW